MYNRQQQPRENGGALFQRQKKSQNSPDMGGDFTLEGDVLDYILDCASRGEPVKLDIAAWRKMSRNNGTFMSISVNIPWQVRRDQQQPVAGDRWGNQQRQQRPSGYGKGNFRPQRQDNFPQDDFPDGDQGPFDDEIPF